MRIERIVVDKPNIKIIEVDYYAPIARELYEYNYDRIFKNPKKIKDDKTNQK